MGIKVMDISPGDSGPLVTQCPSCGAKGTFDKLNVPDFRTHQHLFGQRRCPNPECYSHIFFVRPDSGPIKTYPALRLDFNSRDIPTGICNSFEEALTCHAEGCYVAAGIMIRRTLEELCEERHATGKTLKDRIQALQDKVVLPKELFEALDELRVLGNDAAHIESKDYLKIGDEEIRLGLELTKDLKSHIPTGQSCKPPQVTKG